MKDSINSLMIRRPKSTTQLKPKPVMKDKLV